MSVEQARFQNLKNEFESFLVAGERERFEAIYRDLRGAVPDGDSAHELARLAFADHLLNVLNLGVARRIEPTEAAAAYFGLAAALDFSRLELTIANVSDEDKWERRAAQELADELRSARVSLCTALLDENKEPAAAIDLLRQKRPVEFADAAQLLTDIAAMQTVTMPAVHVAIRAVSRLAAYLRGQLEK